MTIELTSKQPAEAYFIRFDFTDVLLSETISTATVVAIDQEDSSVVTSTITTVGSQVNGTKTVDVWVKAGTSGHDYLITCSIVGSASSAYELDAVLPVLEISSASNTIVSLDDILTFMGIDTSSQYFQISSSNNILKMKYNSGTTTDVTIPDGTYSGTSLATAIKNAINSTLVCSCSVSWNSETGKFTLSITGGNTLAYVHAGSLGGISIGFDKDHAASSSIVSDVAVDDQTNLISILHQAAEKEIRNYCKRDFVLTSYKERYNGTGSTKLLLRNYPVTVLSRLSLYAEDAVRVLNTNTATTATVSVTSTGVVLKKDTTVTTLLFATYTTLTTLVAAINSLSSSGWAAYLDNSTFGSYLSTELIPKFGQSCIRSNSIYLQVPYDAEGDFDVDPDNGMIILNSIFESSHYVFPRGINNIFVDYTAGYATNDMPKDLQLAVKIYTKFLWQKTSEESFGVRSQSTGGVSVNYEGDIPIEAKRILDNGGYKRTIL